MSSDPPDGLADTQQSGPEDEVNLPSDPMADTAAGFADLPSSDDAVRDAAERASVRAKLFASSRAEEAPKVGRYAVLNVLGEGGMGTVYACYDDQLDRRVALKLIKTAESSDSRKRMLREAQAMAKLSHPNVVPVFEVGEHEGQLFVAMEYIRGATLKAWQTEQERPWREVISKYLQAGRGLAAAHAQGLVHRDFKPDNAVVGTDGRVRVLDFGLAAKRGEQEVTDTHVTVMPEAKDAALDTPLTVTGTVMGTPAYMPPEQFMSGVVDARTDQFSFCVALWEGLYGERPFEGKTSTELFTRIAQGKLAEPKNTEVPAAVRGALERGLSSSAEERWPHLAELLGALESKVGAGRRRIGLVHVLLGLTAVALVAVAVVAIARDRWEQSRRELAEQTALAEEQRELARKNADEATRAERAKVAAEVAQRNALLISVAQRLERVPTEAAAVLREAQGAELGEVFGWNATSRPVREQTRELRALLGGEADELYVASFSPDGKRIAASLSDNTVRVLNVDGGGASVTLEGHRGRVWSARFSPDGTRIVTASLDKSVRVWNSDGSGLPLVFKGHTDDVYSASFTQDGRRIITASLDGTARVWNADGTGVPVFMDDRTRVTLAGGEDATGDARTVLWQTPFCHAPKIRTALLGEPEALSRANYDRCLKLTSLCTREDYETCHEAVTRAFAKSPTG